MWLTGDSCQIQTFKSTPKLLKISVKVWSSKTPWAACSDSIEAMLGHGACFSFSAPSLARGWFWCLGSYKASERTHPVSQAEDALRWQGAVYQKLCVRWHKTCLWNAHSHTDSSFQKISWVKDYILCLCICEKCVKDIIQYQAAELSCNVMS